MKLCCRSIIIKGAKADPNESKIIRDKAYTYMKALVDEIREAGKYVFRNRNQKDKVAD